MIKTKSLDELMRNNGGFLKTSSAIEAGVSKTYIGEYVRRRNLVRVAHGLYISEDAWPDAMYVLQVRYPLAIFSHESALFLHRISEREPNPNAITLKTGTNTSNLAKQDVRVYKVKPELHELGLIERNSPAGHLVRTYDLERTICDMVRSRNKIDVQELHASLKAYVRHKDKNLPLLMRYAEEFSVLRIVKQYMEVLMS